MEIVVGGGGEKLYSHNLRDLLRIKEEDHQRNLNQTTSSNSGGGRRNSTGLTLSVVLSEIGGHPPPVDEPPPLIQSNRTLLDIIREDQSLGLGCDREDGRRSWRHLKDKIRLRLRGSGHAWSSTVLVPSSDVPLHNNNPRTTTTAIQHNSNSELGESTQPDARTLSSQRNPSRLNERASGRFQQMISLPRRLSISEDENQQVEEERSGHAAEAVAEGEGSPEQPVRTSLMALLAENDRQMGFESSPYMLDEDEEVDGETSAASAAAVNGVEYNSCCVCMVRRKGAALIPCGHTFCRLCSRELWIQRGSCPLCNNHILEILDIF